MKQLRRAQFGNPVLRQVARRLSPTEIQGEAIQELIAAMQQTLTVKQYGIGLAAPQVGHSVALSVIAIKPTLSRPELERFTMVMINPEIIETAGAKQPLWEGCLSFGDTKNFPYAQVPRWPQLTLRWYDEHAQQHQKTFTGVVAHVIQHEVDHLNGVLFVDRVEDTTSYMTVSEYKKRTLKK